jgi:hypothetical protein
VFLVKKKERPFLRKWSLLVVLLLTGGREQSLTIHERILDGN